MEKREEKQEGSKREARGKQESTKSEARKEKKRRE